MITVEKERARADIMIPTTIIMATLDVAPKAADACVREDGKCGGYF